jgi:peptidoglycan/xylan/chitin deacetylase (PgdA/CDA1 family)
MAPVVFRVKTTNRVVFVTIDDGWTQDPRVLAILKARHVPVTPFLTVNAIRKNTAFFAQVQAITGQHVQDHTIRHPDMRTLDLAGQKAQICDTAAKYKAWFGQSPWLFRPPYGSYNDTTLQAAKECGMSDVVLWDVSLPHSVLKFATGSKLRPGDIILTHWRPDLYKDLPAALDAITAAGFKVAPLQDYLHASS